jgi:peptidoglycan hydrolase-like protein with peptidoglycan-binding domain
MLTNQQRKEVLSNLISSGFKGSYLGELKKYAEGGGIPEIPQKPITQVADATAVNMNLRNRDLSSIDTSQMMDPTIYSKEAEDQLELDAIKQSPAVYNRQVELDSKVDLSTKPKKRTFDLSNVSGIQTYLKDKGYDIGKSGVDDRLGPDTIKAVQKYLKSNGYYVGQDKFANSGVDGKLGFVTMKAIEEFNQDQSSGRKSLYHSKYTGEEGFLGACDEKQCAEFSQKELMRNTTLTEEDLVNKVGFTGNAWNIEKNLLAKGGEQIYSAKKKVNKVDNIKPGDHISIYTGGRSSFQEDAGKGNPTHSAIVDSSINYAENGRPFVYIVHNVHKRNIKSYEGKMFRNKMYLDDLSIDSYPAFKTAAIVSPNLSGSDKRVVSKPDLSLKIDAESESNPYRLKAIEGLNNETFRQRSMADFSLNDKEYMSIATAVLGLMDQESGFGEKGNIPGVSNRVELAGKEVLATVARGVTGGEGSLGWARIKYNTNFKDVEERLRSDYGLTKAKLSTATDRGDNSAKAAMLIVAKYYNQLKQKEGIENPEEALYLALQKFNRYSLGASYGDENKNSYQYAKERNLSYVNKILNNSLKYKVKDDSGTIYSTLTDSLNKEEQVVVNQLYK